MDLRNYKDKLRKYFWFEKPELRDFVILSFIFAFMFSFNEWGTVSFDFSAGIRNLIIALVIVAVSLFAHHAAQRLISLRMGYRPENRIWWPGILIGMIVLIFSNGRVMIFAGCCFGILMLEYHRIGAHRRGPNMRDWGHAAVYGPLASLVLAAFAKAVNLGVGSLFLDKFVLFNFLFAIYNALPFPPLDGSRMLFASRMAYSFFAGAIYGYILLIFVIGITGLNAILLSLLIGAVCWVGFYFIFEKKAMPF